MKKIAINGFGRIGRLVARLALQSDALNLVAINDLAPSSTLAHLFKYDSTHGVFPGKVSYRGNQLLIDDHPIVVHDFPEPAKLPWRELGVDIVVEATGHFLTLGAIEPHLEAGAKGVVLSAPPRDSSIPTIVLGVNDHLLASRPKVVSNASCTTNCLAPIVKVLDHHFTLSNGCMNTIHAYTADQSLQDRPHKDLRRSRAAAVSIIPTSTGAARSIGQILPHLDGKLDGMAMRVPLVNGSVVDFTGIFEKKITKQAINGVLQEAAGGPLQGIVSYTEDPIVSVDVVGLGYSAIIDSQLTYVQDHLAKVVLWYDNEAGYAHRLIDLLGLLVV